MSDTTTSRIAGVNWMIEDFVQRTEGVEAAVCVSSDGLLLAASSHLDRTTADQLSAIVSGLTSLSIGAARVLHRGELNQIIVDLSRGLLMVSSIKDGSALGALATADSDIGLVGYEITMLVQRFGAALTPDLIAELKSQPLP